MHPVIHSATHCLHKYSLYETVHESPHGSTRSTACLATTAPSELRGAGQTTYIYATGIPAASPDLPRVHDTRSGRDLAARHRAALAGARAVLLLLPDAENCNQTPPVARPRPQKKRHARAWPRREEASARRGRSGTCNAPKYVRWEGNTDNSRRVGLLLEQRDGMETWPQRPPVTAQDGDAPETHPERV